MKKIKKLRDKRSILDQYNDERLTSTASVPLSIRSIFVRTPNVLSPAENLDHETTFMNHKKYFSPLYSADKEHTIVTNQSSSDGLIYQLFLKYFFSMKACKLNMSPIEYV